MTKRSLAAAAAALALGAGAALAHHGWGEYDADKVLTMAGAIESVQPGNPHVSVRLRHEGKLWTAVLAPPSRMVSRGLPPETLKPGLAVTLEGYPKKSGEPEMRAERITVAGAKVELR